ncbi:MAG TPA: Fic family protein [Solirubrobacterales bacterium]|jgi:Fic family protein|nr:Fic family protein [Solirubrobacterales bacterium]
MVFQSPELQEEELEVIDLLAQQREQLRDRVAEPRRWSGTLRRMAFARAVQGSNSIEGYNASLDDVFAAVEEEPTLGAGEETQLALAGYRDAMTYVLQIADDESLEVDEGLLKSLHFMMLRYDLKKNPGRWRPGPIFIHRETTNEIVYEGPPSSEIPSLITEMLDELDGGDEPVIIKAAMAHLNLTMVHPFSDGNGRMARCLQTLVLARDRVIAPVFSGVEEFLGRNTEAYYGVLEDVGAGAWHPERNARPWVRFCMRAHYLQATTTMRRREEIEGLWNNCVGLTEKENLPERCAAGLMDASIGVRIRRKIYRSSAEAAMGEEISDLTASRDLKAMVDTGLLDAVGERRGRYYLAGATLTRLREQVRSDRPPKSSDDPFAIVRERRQLKLT